jgi:hypothetical protein
VKLLVSSECTNFGFAHKPSVLVFDVVQLVRLTSRRRLRLLIFHSRNYCVQADRPSPENPEEAVIYCRHLFLVRAPLSTLLLT